MLATMARVRPSRSATKPKTMPPNADASNVHEATIPAPARSEPNSAMTWPSTIEKIIRSITSSAQPR